MYVDEGAGMVMRECSERVVGSSCFFLGESAGGDLGVREWEKLLRGGLKRIGRGSRCSRS